MRICSQRVVQVFVSGTVRKDSNGRSPYHGSAGFGAFAAAIVLGSAMAAGGCSMSMPSLFGDKDNDKSPAAVSAVFDSKSTKTAKADGDPTGSLSLQPAAGGKGAWSPADWSIAKSALREVLGRGEAGSSQPWENPTTGARGTVTPVAAIYEKDGFPCRNFIVGGVRDGRETWYEGTACRIHRGQWDVVTTRPLQKS
jgi:surface antigen